MDDKEIIGLIEETLIDKLNKNSNIIRYTFYELRVKYNLSEHDTFRFLDLIRIKLQNKNYKVYSSGAMFEYNNINLKVQDNELIVAVKEI